MLTGSVTDQATDVSLPDPVQPLGFTRYYTSGGGWRHSFDLRFEDLGRDYPCISMPDGQMIPFRPVQSQSQSLTNTRLSGSADPVRRVKTSSKPAEGVIEPPIPPTHTQWVTYRDVDWKLSKCDDEYEVDMGDGALVRFSMDGRMLSQVDSHGNTLDFAYDWTNLVSVSRNGTVAFTLSYSDGHLVRVATPDSSYFAEYAYSEKGDLATGSRASAKVRSMVAADWCASRFPEASGA